MKRLALLSLALVCAFCLPACIKATGASEVKADASGTISFTFAVNMESIETIKGLGEMAGEEMEGVEDALGSLDEVFDEKKIAEALKKQGMEITSAKSFEKDGWKTVEVAAKFKDINAVLAKVEKAQKEGMEDLPMDLPLGDMSLVPSFYKTDKQGVGEVVVIPSITDLMAEAGPMDLEELEDQLEEMGDEELDMIEGQLEMMKQMFGIDEMKMGIELKLPGAVMTTTGCKKVGENGIKFSIGGGDMNMDGLRNFFGLKNGISATFAIPADCKIQFKDKKSAKQTGKDGEEEKSDEKKKKGGLKIGGGKQG